MEFIQKLKRFWKQSKQRLEEHKAKELERLDRQIEIEKKNNIIYDKRKELESLRNKRNKII